MPRLAKRTGGGGDDTLSSRAALKRRLLAAKSASALAFAEEEQKAKPKTKKKDGGMGSSAAEPYTTTVYRAAAPQQQIATVPEMRMQVQQQQPSQPFIPSLVLNSPLLTFDLQSIEGIRKTMGNTWVNTFAWFVKGYWSGLSSVPYRSSPLACVAREAATGPSLASEYDAAKAAASDEKNGASRALTVSGAADLACMVDAIKTRKYRDDDGRPYVEEYALHHYVPLSLRALCASIMAKFASRVPQAYVTTKKNATSSVLVKIEAPAFRLPIPPQMKLPEQLKEVADLWSGGTQSADELDSRFTGVVSFRIPWKNFTMARATKLYSKPAPVAPTIEQEISKEGNSGLVALLKREREARGQATTATTTQPETDIVQLYVESMQQVSNLLWSAILNKVEKPSAALAANLKTFLSDRSAAYALYSVAEMEAHMLALALWAPAYGVVLDADSSLHLYTLNQMVMPRFTMNPEVVDPIVYNLFSGFGAYSPPQKTALIR